MINLIENVSGEAKRTSEKFDVSLPDSFSNSFKDCYLSSF